jgi:hypothetical protein
MPSLRLSLLAIAAVSFGLNACAASQSEPGSDADELVSAPPTPGTTGAPGSCVALDGKADKRCTPGAFNPDVTQATINSTICVSGWTATIRPSIAFTNGLKNQQKPLYGEDSIANRDLEEDHLVPLELGGNPHDANNLWPQPRETVSPGHGAETKDQEESLLKHQVCSGQMTLDAARQKMLADWTH